MKAEGMTNKVIILLGSTGVGKSGVSILLAKALDTEIISADSMQIYRHMDIGTAKPTLEERAMVNHHMIDVVNPWETYSTGKYIEAAGTIIEELHKTGKVPIIVGGTGLYIKAMTRGIFSGPSADWSLREKLLSMEKEEKGSLYHLLKDLDTEAAGRMTPNDTRRIIRAIEVCLKSVSSMSEMQRKMTKPLPYEFIKIGLYRGRKELYRMIEQRVDKMISKGLVEEAKRVIEMIKDTATQGNGTLPMSSMQAIGYKEFDHYLRGEISLEEAIRLIKKRSKSYAKRQSTWFKKEEGIYWLDITGIDDSGIIFNLISDVLAHASIRLSF
jgi:tRNA dimethylallyltransferase